MFDSLLLMLSGMFLIMFGGWLLLLCTYRGVLLGFMNGLCTPVLKQLSIKETCPVNQKCQTSSLIYQATVTRHDNNKEESYIELTDNTFKTRYNGHTSSFRNEQYRNATTLSNYIWTLKDKNINYSLKWKITDRGRAYQPSGKICGLSDLEKFYIISRPELASLNQRNELATSCRHRKKHLLCNK